MAVNRRTFPVAADDVWSVLADGFQYDGWVVGTSGIRAVDDFFPEPGTRIHYVVGRGPIRHEGHTEVLDVTDGRQMVLEAHAWPLGSVYIRLDIEPDGDGQTNVTLTEHPHQGLAKQLHNPVFNWLIQLRNIQTLRRLERLSREQAARSGQA